MTMARVGANVLKGKSEKAKGKSAVGVTARRALTFFLFPFSFFLPFLSSCRDGSKPQAIWCSTGVGPAQVVYPRGITYQKLDDTFYVVDRMARVQHLDHDGKWLADWRMPEWKVGKPVGLAAGGAGGAGVGIDCVVTGPCPPCTCRSPAC